jgi:replicative DNA helicase
MVANPDRKTKKFDDSVVCEHFTGRVQPHSVDFEQALLACCIIEGGQDSITLSLQNRISIHTFYLPAHKILWDIIVNIYEEGIPVNEIFLADRLKSMGKLDSIGGIDFINKICDRIDTPAQIVHYVKRVRDVELTRRIITASVKNIERAYGEADELDEFIERAENEIFAISSDRISDCAVPIKKSIISAVNTIQLMLHHRGELTGLPSVFADLDRMTFGFRPSEMIVITTRPFMGKNSFAMNIAENVLAQKNGYPHKSVLFFSLEMSSEQLALSMLGCRAGVNMTKLHDGFIPKSASESLLEVAKELQAVSLWIDESTNLTILEIRAKSRRIHSKEHVDLIVIDYLQFINGDSRISREQQISEISRGIKAMAKELKIPVIVLSQLNRDSERERRQPKLSDLRES